MQFKLFFDQKPSYLYIFLTSKGDVQAPVLPINLPCLDSEPDFQSESGITDPIQSGSQTMPLPSVKKPLIDATGRTSTYLFLSMQLKSDTEEQEKIEYPTHQIHTPAWKK